MFSIVSEHRRLHLILSFFLINKIKDTEWDYLRLSIRNENEFIFPFTFLDIISSEKAH